MQLNFTFICKIFPLNSCEGSRFYSAASEHSDGNVFCCLAFNHLGS